MPSPVHEDRGTRRPVKLLSGLAMCRAPMDTMSAAEGKGPAADNGLQVRLTH